MGKVEANYIEASIHKLPECLFRAAGGAEGCNDLGAAEMLYRWLNCCN
jgi:hypothetical protein